MLRRVSCLLTALFAFLFGVSLHSTHRLIVELLEPGYDQSSIQPLPVERQEPPLRLGIFGGVDGVTFSSNNSKFNLFEDYTERETIILVSQEELSETVQKLGPQVSLKKRSARPPPSAYP